MIEITSKTLVKDIKKIPELKEAIPYFISGGGLATQMISYASLDNLEKNAGWNAESTLNGIKRLIEVAKAGNYLYPVYSQEESQGGPKKKDVNIIYFPPKKAIAPNDKSRPFVMVCAGGAYTAVCSMVEAYPVAAKLNELGYPAFVLTYRTGGKGLLPKPLDDLAAAIKYVIKHADQFKIDPKHYIVCGFSAGGNLTSLWGTENHGFATYGLPKPKAMFPVYPAVSNRLFNKDKSANTFCETMLGKNYSEEKLREYNVDEHVGRDYPPCYIVCCKDDPVVPSKNSERLKEVLEEKGIPVRLEEGEKGGHGFGEGRGTDVEGWIERAVAFCEAL
ncbi:MAG TPA: alpha/beta hydrolase [Clostridiales bacterium]|nr:alpha/beta hydrolase [Clostridiales bacterium]